MQNIDSICNVRCKKVNCFPKNFSWSPGLFWNIGEKHKTVKKSFVWKCPVGAQINYPNCRQLYQLRITSNKLMGWNGPLKTPEGPFLGGWEGFSNSHPHPPLKWGLEKKTVIPWRNFSSRWWFSEHKSPFLISQYNFVDIRFHCVIPYTVEMFQDVIHIKIHLLIHLTVYPQIHSPIQEFIHRVTH